MSGNICSYVNCKRSSRSNPGLRKCFFPTNDEEICQKWLLFCGTSSLTLLDKEKLKKNFLCSEHFSDNLLHSKKLPKGALPYDHRSLTERPEKPLRQYYNKRSRLSGKSTDDKKIDNSNVATLEINPVSSLERKREDVFHIPLKDKAPIPGNILNPPATLFLQKLSQVSPPKSVEEKQPTIQRKVVRELKSMPFLPRTIMNMQLYHKDRTPWKKEEIRAALYLFNKSARTYIFLRKSGFILPSVAVIKRSLSYRTKPVFIWKNLENTTAAEGLNHL